MKGFFKFVFASCLGTALFILVLGVVIWIIVGIASLFGGDDDKKIKDGSILQLNLDNEIIDRTEEKDFNFDFGGFSQDNKDGLNNILKQIERASQDENIEGIYLELSEIPTRGTTIEEIRDKLVEFKESGKWVYTYSESMSQNAYHLASVSDSIFLHPEGGMLFKGIFSEILFMKGFLEKIGVEYQVVRPDNNKFKSAVEPFIMDKMSDANRKQIRKLIDGIWDGMLNNISESRGISKEKLNELADNIEIRLAEDAVEYGLIDGAIYEDEMMAFLREKLDLEDDDKIPFVSLGSYSKKSKDEKGWSKREKIGVVYAYGGISSGEGDAENIGSETVANAIRRARKDSSIKAIVLRVNSPGGSALASDVIWRETVLAKETKPFIVSMGDLAASGGYYISCAADKIYATENTITGSIGVFGLIPNIQELLNDHLGLTTDTVKTNNLSDFYTGTRPFKKEEEEVIQEVVNDIYIDFISRVAEGRGLEMNFVDSIAQGRVWTGEDALELGLVDEIGGFEKALDYAAEAAGLEEYRVREYPRLKDPFEELMKEFSTEITVEDMLIKELGENYELFVQLKEMQKVGNLREPQMRLPFHISIK